MSYMEKNIPVTVTPDMMAEFRIPRKVCYMEYGKAVTDDSRANLKQMLKVQEEDFHPAYVPCAMFNMHVSGDIELTGRRTVKDQKGDTWVSCFSTKLILSLSYEKVPVSLARGIPTGIIRTKQDELTAYTREKAGETEILSAEGTPASQAGSIRNDIAKSAVKTTIQHLDNRFHDICYKAPPPKQLIPMITAEYAGEALIPVWIARYGKQKQKTAVVNGITGDVWFRPSISPKFLLLKAGCFLLIAALLLGMLAAIFQLAPKIAPVLALVILAAVCIAGIRIIEKNGSGSVPLQPQNRKISIPEHRCFRTYKISDDDD